jgi:hypothetical protein
MSTEDIFFASTSETTFKKGSATMTIILVTTVADIYLGAIQTVRSLTAETELEVRFFIKFGIYARRAVVG